MNKFWLYMLISSFVFLGIITSNMVNGATLSIVTSDQVRVGDNLKILIILANTTDNETISNQRCTIYTIDQNNNTVDLVAYDSLLNEPPSLLTNGLGRAYYSLYISNKYPISNAVSNNTEIHADCGGAITSANFQVLPYNPQDQLFNFLISIRNSPWVYVFGILILLILVAIIKMIIDTKRLW